MIESPFDYDVFLSFASSDEDVVRPVWQHLTVSGLRVFWSDVTLRESVGASWFDIIQDAVGRSRHLVLVCSRASLESKWVKREYIAFFNNYHSSTRRLIPLLISAVSVTDLPLFLRELESVRLADPNALQLLVRTVGGVDIDALHRELSRRDQELAEMRHELGALRQRLAEKRIHPANDAELRNMDSGRQYTAPMSLAVSSAPSVSDQTQRIKSRWLGDGNDEITRFVRYLARTTGCPIPLIIAMIAIVGLILLIIVALSEAR
jgi:hypothetical protein